MALLDFKSRYVYLVRAEFADPEREAGWNRWYDETHVPMLLAVPGVLSCTRYQERDASGKYLAAYEIADPAVLEHPRYREVAGWGPWAEYIKEWQRGVFAVVEPAYEAVEAASLQSPRVSKPNREDDQ